MNDEIRARFLAAIAKQVDADRVIEIHLFPGIRQGGAESGVAVIAVRRGPAPSLDVDGGHPAIAEPDIAHAVIVSDDESPYKDEPSPLQPPSRYTVFSARYRHTLKGLDRGKWEVSVTEEADAPLVTVDAVVRGVQRRSGDGDETLRLSGDEFRAGLPVDLSASA